MQGPPQAPPTPPASPSALAPLGRPVFRWLWLASLASQMGTRIQNVGAVDLMTALAPAAVMLALVQTATSLPGLFLGLPRLVQAIAVPPGFVGVRAGRGPDAALLDRGDPATQDGLRLLFRLQHAGARDGHKWDDVEDQHSRAEAGRHGRRLGGRPSGSRWLGIATGVTRTAAQEA